jgi:hypothetical protein
VLTTILTRGSLREFTRAMRTTCRLDRDRHGAGRAFLRNWRGSWRRPFQLVHRFDHEKNTEGDDDEINHESDEISVVPSHCACLGGLGRSIKGAAAGCGLEDDEFVGEIEAAGK